MKSAANALLEMFGVPGPIRPAKLETLIVSLIYTLNNNNLLEAAVSDVVRYTDLEQQTVDGLKYIKTLTSSPKFISLYNKQKAFQLLLQILPEVSLIDTYGVVTIDEEVLLNIVNRTSKSNRYREVKRVLRQLNAGHVGFFIVQPPNTPSNEFHILKCDTVETAVGLLAEHNIQTPATLDAILKKSK